MTIKFPKNTEHIPDIDIYNINEVQESGLETNKSIFTVIDSTWFEGIVSQIKYDTDWSKLCNKLWKAKFRWFIYYFIGSNEIHINKKKYLLKDIFSYNWSTSDIFNVFSENDLEMLAKFCLENWLIDGFKKNYTYFLKYIKNDIFEIINSDNYKWEINNFIISKLNKDQQEEIILNKKNRSLILNFLWNWGIFENWNFSNTFQEKIIDIIFDEYKEITNFDWNVRDNWWPTYAKSILNEAVSILISNNTNHYFNRLMNLDQNDFRKAVQKTHQTSILWYLNHTEESDINEELIRLFLNKIVDCVWINYLKDNRTKQFDNNYYYFMNKYYPEVFENINIEDALNKKTYLKCDKKYLINKLLETSNWFESILNTDNLYLFEDVILDERLQDKLLDDNNEKNIIDYIFLLQFQIGNYYILNENNFLEKIIKKVYDKKDNTYLEKILNNWNILKFIKQYRDRFNSFDDIIKNENIRNLLQENSIVVGNVISFINLSQNIENFKFDLHLEDIDKNFIFFIKKLFKYKKVNWEYQYVKEIKISSREIKNRWFEELNKIFDVEILNYDDFKKWEIKTEILHNKEYSENILLENLKVLCEKFDITYNISNFVKIEKEYNEYKWEKPVLLSDFLNVHDNVLEKIDFLNDFFNRFNFLKNNSEKIPNLSAILNKIKKDHWVESLDDVEYNTNVEYQEELIKEIEQKNNIVLTKKFNINEILNFLDITKNLNNSDLTEDSWFYHHIKLLDQYVENFNIDDVLKFNWKTFELSDDIENLIEKFGNHINGEIRYFLNVFNNLDEEKIISFFDFFNKINLKIEVNWNYDRYSIEKLSDVIWDYFNLKDYDDLWVKNKVFLVRYLIQKSLDENDYSHLEDNLNNILRIQNYKLKNNVFDFNLLKEKIDTLLEETENFISMNLLRAFVFWQRDWMEQENNTIVLPIRESIEYTKKITWIEIKTEDLQNNNTINLIEGIWLWMINSNNIANENNIKNWKEILEFFLKNPNYKWRKWVIKDIYEWWILENILKYINISNRLMREKQFTLVELEELFSYDLDYVLIEDKEDDIFNNKNWFYYWYFKEAVNYFYSWNDVGLDDKLPINIRNFPEYMWDDEILINLDIDKNFEWYNREKLPWTKKWFLEKPERKQYLNFDNIEIIKENWTAIWLGMLWEDFFEFIDDINNVNLWEKFNLLKEIIWINKYILYSYVWEKNGFIFNENIFNIVKGLNINLLRDLWNKNILNLNTKSIKLLFWYLREYWISIYYFLSDINSFNLEELDIKMFNYLLRNRIYPTKNIIKYLEEWWTIDELLLIKKNYKNDWWFDVLNEIHTDLEYIDFRYIIDLATKDNLRVWRWYDEFKQLITKEYNIDEDNEEHYKQAWYESYVAKQFIDKIKLEEQKINVFSNFSYWKVITWAFKDELLQDPNINFNQVRIWSTECHSRVSYLNINTFSKYDIKKLFYYSSIILDWSSNNSFPDSNIWFKSYFYILNKALSEILNDSKFIEWYNSDFITDIQKSDKYNLLINELKQIILKNKLYIKAKPFKFIYVSQNEKMSLKTRSNDRDYCNKVLDTSNINYNNIYYWDFVDRNGKYSNRQAYFDDTHIIDFVIIPTDKWFNFVDTNFEKRLEEKYEFFKNKWNNDINFNFLEELKSRF